MNTNLDLPKMKAEMQFANSSPVDSLPIDSSGKLLPHEIVRKAVGDSKFIQTHKRLMEALNNKKYRMMRENNSLFFYEIAKKKEAKLISVYNTDDNVTSTVNFVKYLMAMKAAKFKTVDIPIDNDGYLNGLKKMGFNVTKNKNETSVVRF
jgi:hypothetical protein